MLKEEVVFVLHNAGERCCNRRRTADASLALADNEMTA